MSKYDNFGMYLKATKATRLRLRFKENEAIPGFALSRSKIDSSWWSNSPSNNPFTRIWLDAGWETPDVDPASSCLAFLKVR